VREGEQSEKKRGSSQLNGGDLWSKKALNAHDQNEDDHFLNSELGGARRDFNSWETTGRSKWGE